jgi:hypothetical protein
MGAKAAAIRPGKPLPMMSRESGPLLRFDTSGKSPA